MSLKIEWNNVLHSNLYLFLYSKSIFRTSNCLARFTLNFKLLKQYCVCICYSFAPDDFDSNKINKNPEI